MVLQASQLKAAVHAFVVDLCECCRPRVSSNRSSGSSWVGSSSSRRRRQQILLSKEQQEQACW